ncbi:LysR substrate-binding domain-containing protein [Chitinibacter sp. S2-10]|uniref:LysR substrate-binding domain-containing protein n=1 Tax=Chitinibacter sp. S2-10 TaxID=3373597 RepID=UPI003977AB7C
MNPLPPLPALRAFEAVSRLGSVVKAADALSVTHSAISHQIHALEDYLGLPLFERSGRKLALTEDGRNYALQIRMALNDMAEATRTVRARPKPNEIKLTTMPSFGLGWLIPRVPEFQALFPQYRLDIRAGLGFDDLHTGQLDLAIRMGAGDWEGLKTQHLLDDYLVVVAAPQYPHLPRTLAELSDLEHGLERAQIIGTLEKWSSWVKEAQLGDWSPTFSLFCNDNNLALQAVRLGQGITLTRLSLVLDDLRSGQLVLLGGVIAPHPNRYWLVWAPRADGSAKLHHFMHWLQTAAARSQQAMNDYISGVYPSLLISN